VLCEIGFFIIDWKTGPLSFGVAALIYSWLFRIRIANVAQSLLMTGEFIALHPRMRTGAIRTDLTVGVKCCF
jgi:hypothetical protein